ncbi:MAG: class I SAM-dependent methyltransferase [Myxococcota bacterium]
MTDPLDSVRAYFSRRMKEHGSSPRGVDWNTVEAQELRFAQVMNVRDHDGPFTLVDWGCGYGALYDFLKRYGLPFTYVGYDITPPALMRARTDHPGVMFVGGENEIPECEFVVASGVFNIKLDTSAEAWRDFVHDQLKRMFAKATRGIASTFLTTYSDPPKRRPDLFYADPLQLFDFAKRELSPNVALLHDYGHWDFTLVVRKAAP